MTADNQRPPWLDMTAVGAEKRDSFTNGGLIAGWGIGVLFLIIARST